MATNPRQPRLLPVLLHGIMAAAFLASGPGKLPAQESVPPDPSASPDSPDSPAPPTRKPAPAKPPAATPEADPLAGGELQIGKRETPPAPPAPPCAVCTSTGRIEQKILPPYILFERDAAPDPALSLGWKPCPDCARGKRMEALFEAERRRLAQRQIGYARHEKALGLSFLDFETRHVTAHFQSTEAEARTCARLWERLAGVLRKNCGRDFLPIGPGARHLVVCENEKRYRQYLQYIAHSGPPAEDKKWWKLARQSASFGSRNLTIIRRDLVVPPKGAGLPHMATFSLARMWIRGLSGNRAPAWFAEGFSSLCESIVLGQPRSYSIRYEPNTLSFQGSWSRQLAAGLRKDKVRPWAELFSLELIGLSVLDYQQCWSVTRFLFRQDGRAFAKLPGLFKKGRASQAAVQKAYGRPLQKLEAAWRAWALRGR